MVGVKLTCGPHTEATTTPSTISPLEAIASRDSGSFSTRKPTATQMLTKTTPSAVSGATIVSGVRAYITASSTIVLKRKSAKANWNVGRR